MSGVQCNHFRVWTNIVQRRIKCSLEKKWNYMKPMTCCINLFLSINISHLIWTTMKIIPRIIKNHNNTFTKPKKIVFSFGKQREEYKNDFSFTLCRKEKLWRQNITSLSSSNLSRAFFFRGRINAPMSFSRGSSQCLQVKSLT